MSGDRRAPVSGRAPNGKYFIRRKPLHVPKEEVRRYYGITPNYKDEAEIDGD